ncbi:MAG: YciI family protein [Candidatus Sulfotelmatobacter sp.]
MKYILMMNTMRAGHGVPSWKAKDLQAHIAFMLNLNKDLRESGEFVSAEGLSFPDQAKQVRAGKDGIPITDGIFPESKEFLAGFWIIDVDSPERAYAIAARISAAPGPEGTPLNMSIEVRPIMSAPPPEMV